MSELRIPIGRYAKRVFWTVVGLSILVVLGLRIFVVPAISGGDAPGGWDAVDQVLGEVFATVFAITVLSTIIVLLSAPSRKATDLQVVHPKDISVILDRTLTATRTWSFNGSTGRWNRAKVLPRLAQQARNSNTPREVHLVILDPLLADVCEAYGSYRSGVRTGTGEEWPLDRVRRDLYATILAAAFEKAGQSLLSVRVSVKAFSSVFRFDASDQKIVMTREDPKEPALSCDEGSYYYDAFRASMSFDRNQSRELRFPAQCPKRGETDVEVVRELFRELDLYLEQLDSDQEVTSIIELAEDRDGPY